MRIATFITSDPVGTATFDPNVVRDALWKTADDLGIVIKAHFLVEKSLWFACNRLAPFFSKFDDGRQRYFLGYLSFLDAFGLPREILEPCQELNRIRNAFAHRGAWELCGEEVDRLILAMPPGFRGLHPSKAHVSMFGRTFLWKDGSPRDRFAIASADLSKYIWTLSIPDKKTISLQGVWMLAELP